MATRLYDTFSSGASQDINAHAADSPASNWTKHASASKLWRVINGRAGINEQGIQGIAYHSASIPTPLGQWMYQTIIDNRSSTGDFLDQVGCGVLVASGAPNGYFVMMSQSTGSLTVTLLKWPGAGTYTTLASAVVPVAAAYKIATKVTNNAGAPRIRVYMNGVEVIDHTNAGGYTSGQTGLYGQTTRTLSATNGNGLYVDILHVADAVTLTPDSATIYRGQTKAFVITGTDTKFTALGESFVLESSPSGCSIVTQSSTSDTAHGITLLAGSTDGDIVLRSVTTGETVTIAVTDWPHPDPPTLVEDEHSYNSATLSWNVVAGHTYQLHRSGVSGFTPSGASEVAGATSTPALDTPISADTDHYYKVVSTNAGGKSTASNQVLVHTDAPPAATGITLTGPSTAVVGEVVQITVALTPPQGTTASPVTVQLTDTPDLGSIAPSSVQLSTLVQSQQITFVATQTGAVTITTSNNGSLDDGAHGITVVQIPKVREIASDTAELADVLYGQILDDYGRVWDGSGFVSRNTNNWVNYAQVPTEPVPAVYRWEIPSLAASARWLRLYRKASAGAAVDSDDQVLGDYALPVSSQASVDPTSIATGLAVYGAPTVGDLPSEPDNAGISQVLAHAELLGAWTLDVNTDQITTEGGKVYQLSRSNGKIVGIAEVP